MRLILIILFLFSSNLYGQYVSVYCGGMLPVRRSFIGVEVGKRIESVSIGLSAETSPTETNISPKLNLHLKDIRLEGGMGWGHRFGENNDHNYHTYTLGVFFERKRLFFGSSMLWRSYQAHIGLHRGTLRAIVGYRFE